MAKKNENRVLVSLVCEECKNANYTVSKNKKNTTERLELNKYFRLFCVILKIYLYKSKYLLTKRADILLVTKL